MERKERLQSEMKKYMGSRKDGCTFHSLYEYLLGTGLITETREDRKLVVQSIRELEQTEGVVFLLCPIKKHKEPKM